MKPPIIQRREFRAFLLVAAPVLLFSLCYWSELFATISFVYVRIRINPALSLDDATRTAFLKLTYEFGVFAVLFIFSVVLVSRFVLPAQTREERRKVLGRLWLYIRGRHGAALFVQDGNLVASQAEREHPPKGPGIALVDAVSALALEHDTLPNAKSTKLKRHKRRGITGQFYRWEKQLAGAGYAPLAVPLHWWRYPGVISKRYSRATLLALKLIKARRPHKPPKGVARVEGPGIVFTDADEVVRETLDLRKQKRSRQNIKALTREGLEVHTTIIVTFMLDDQPTASQPAEDNNNQNTQRNRPAFKFNRESAFHAVYGTPVAKDESIKAWTDLPAFVASDIFRDMISTQKLDDLLRPTSDDELPVPLVKFRTDFNNKVQVEQILKDRGIKVISAGFDALTPDPLIVGQRLRHWQTEWKRRSVETLASGDLQATRITQRARIKAQSEMLQQMTDILRHGNAKAVIALRLIQTLEAACADPSTRSLLPAEAITVLTNWFDNLKDWLVPSAVPVLPSGAEKSAPQENHETV